MLALHGACFIERGNPVHTRPSAEICQRVRTLLGRRA